MKIYLIRHAKTQGNLLKKYIGSTDESLCSEGIKQASMFKCEAVDRVYVSPMKRCIETANIVYGSGYEIIEGLKEIDFGPFENKNYIELSGDREYQEYIDSGGTKMPASAESLDAYKKRTIESFDNILKHDYNSIAIVAHGGSIMTIMEHMEGRAYFDYHVDNCDGYVCEYIDGRFESIEKISERLR